MPRSRLMSPAPRLTAPPAAPPPPSRPTPRARPGGLSLTAVLEDLTPDPAAAAKDRAARLARLLWWTHRRLEYETAVLLHGEDAMGLPPCVTAGDVAEACGLGRRQREVLTYVEPGDDEPTVLRYVTHAVDSG